MLFVNLTEKYMANEVGIIGCTCEICCWLVEKMSYCVNRLQSIKREIDDERALTSWKFEANGTDREGRRASGW